MFLRSALVALFKSLQITIPSQIHSIPTAAIKDFRTLLLFPLGFKLHLDLHSALSSPAFAKVGQQVGDIIPRMTVQTSAQSLLVEVVGNETNASSQDKQTVQDTHLEVVLGLFGGEGTTVAHQVNEADGDTAVNVEDQAVLLGGCDGLDGQSIVEQLVAGELGADVLLDKLNTQIGVVS